MEPLPRHEDQAQRRARSCATRAGPVQPSDAAAPPSPQRAHPPGCCRRCFSCEAPYLRRPRSGRSGCVASRWPLHHQFGAPRLLLLMALLLAPAPAPGPIPLVPWEGLLSSETPFPSLAPPPGSERTPSSGPNPGQICGLARSRPAAAPPLPRRRRHPLPGLLLAAAVSPAGGQGSAAAATGGAGTGPGAALSGLLPAPGGGDAGKGKGSLLMRPSFDASLDWASNITAKGKDGCTLAKQAASPAFVPPRCPPPRRPVGIDEARRLGWRFAPLLHQHSLDWSRLSDPGAWLQSAVLIDPVTYTTTDLTTYLENRHRARRARVEKAAAEAEAAAAAAAGGGGGAAARAAAAAAKATAAAAEAAAADPYWTIHEAYDTHNFFATRLVRRRYGAAAAHGREAQQGPEPQRGTAPAAAAAGGGGGDSEPSAAGVRGAPDGEQEQASGGRRRRRITQAQGEGRRRRRGLQEGEEEREALAAQDSGEAGGGSGGGGDGDGDGSGRVEETDPYWPHFEALQGSEFFEAVAGDPLQDEGAERDGAREGGKAAEKQGRRAAAAAAEGLADDGGGDGGDGRDSGGGGGSGGSRAPRLGGKVYYTVFEPRLEHLRWSRPAHTATPTGPGAGAGPAGDPGPAGGGGGGGGGAEPTHAYVYTFWFFYPFNGCSNQLMATRFAGRHQAAEYFLCPLGVHEGDWEHLKVYVCQDGMLDEQEPARAVAALQYSQHTWLPTYDCTKGGWPGDCSFESDPDSGHQRPRVYSGLHSHANSPHTSNLNVYAKVNFKQLLNFDGIYVADRFAGGGPLFVPSADNTLWLPFPHEMGAGAAAAGAAGGGLVRPEDMRPGGRLAWAAYMGNWGVPLTSPNFSITCLTHNLSAASPCDPRNPPVFILDRLLGGVGAEPGDITWTPVLSPKRVAPELSEPISCPLVRRAAAYSWERELAAPLWDDREPLPGLGGLSLAALARDTSSLACPLAEDVHRPSSWGGSSQYQYRYLGNDPRVAHRLRLFVGAATAAVVMAAALSALVVKCMPLMLAPHHRHHRHHNHHHHNHNHHHHSHQHHSHGGYGGYGGGGGGFELYDSGGPGEPYDESYHEERQRDGGSGGEVARGARATPLLGMTHAFGMVYGKVDVLPPYEPLPLHDDGSRHGVATSSVSYRAQRGGGGGGGVSATRRQGPQGGWDEQGGGGGGAAAAAFGGGASDGDGSGSGSGVTSSESYSDFNHTPTASDGEATATAPDGPSYGAHAHPLSYGGPASAATARHGSGASVSGAPPNPKPQHAAATRFSSESGSGGAAAAAAAGGGGGSAVPAHRRGSEEQPLLASTSGRRRRDSGGDDDDDDDDGVKPRRGVSRRGWGSLVFRTASTCPAAALLPLRAWRCCLAAGRCVCGALCFPCRRFCPGGGGGGVDVSSGSAAAPSRWQRQRRRRGLGPYLLGCATQPERRLLWLSLGVMAYSLGLVMSAQGLLVTLHALRNLLLRGLWAIAGLEGLFVALLAAGGLLELALMVAAVSLAPKPETPERHSSSHTRRTSAPAAVPTAPAPSAAAAAAAAEDPAAAAAGGPSLPPSSAPNGGPPPPPPPPSSSAALQPLSTKASGAANGTAPAVTPASYLPPLLGSRPASAGGGGGGAASDWESYSNHHLQFPSTAAVAATAAAATAAATAAASAAASAAATAAAKVPWRTIALLAAVGYMEVAASLHLLGFGLALWVGVLGASEGCSAAVQGLYRVISFSPDVCLDLSVIGVPGPRCGGDLMQLCNVWRQLRLSGLLYGSILIIAARLLLLVMAAANYHSRHMVLLQLPPPHPPPPPHPAWHHHRQGQGHHHHQHHEEQQKQHHHPQTRRRQQQQQQQADGEEASGSGQARRRGKAAAVVAAATEAAGGGGGGGGGGGLVGDATQHWRESGQEPRRRSGRRRKMSGRAGGAGGSTESGGGGGGGGQTDAGGGGGGGGLLPVSTSAAAAAPVGGSVVVEMGAMGSAAAGGAGAGTSTGGGGGGGGGPRGARWGGLFGF
ncbi:hypothetical protein PLESTB_001456100 [Pleodorina starrii]|uniref:Uncharacterized protein n=1 Tax=Pleodorina starrii TaxID=330485 RepID=A0A9W6F7B7_9CHLO|nr:hypothetical protein PLESTM_002043200 [Pleodorina starrii]GLC59172.1 hypothetical protein PLESTB_001456100 [Pleodorina starrii]GLC65021.1 hypothetical protein PLESTF_000236900 [Pleodorina starrii]